MIIAFLPTFWKSGMEKSGPDKANRPIMPDDKPYEIDEFALTLSTFSIIIVA